MRIAVIGAGAIGSLYGGLLAASGNDVVLVGRVPHVEAIRRSGLLVEGFLNKHVKNVRAESEALSLKPETFDLILITVKAYDTEQAALQAKHLIGSETLVLCLQNGLGVEETAEKILGKNNLLRGVTFCGATLEKPGVVIYAGHGETVIGEPYKGNVGGGRDVAEVFEEAGLPTRVEEDLRGTVWTKTLINAGINPYSTLLGVKNGELLKFDGVKALMAQTVQEGVRVASKVGVSLKEDPVSLMFQTVGMTANNVNSMLQDVRNGRRTEVDYINGAISKIGEREGVATPLNSLLTSLVKALEIKARRKE